MKVTPVASNTEEERHVLRRRENFRDNILVIAYWLSHVALLAVVWSLYLYGGNP